MLLAWHKKNCTSRVECIGFFRLKLSESCFQMVPTASSTTWRRTSSSPSSRHIRPWRENTLRTCPARWKNKNFGKYSANNDQRKILIQWRSEIRTSLDFVWSKRGWVEIGLDLHGIWNPEAQHLKSRQMVNILSKTIWNPDKNVPFSNGWGWDYSYSHK